MRERKTTNAVVHTCVAAAHACGRAVAPARPPLTWQTHQRPPSSSSASRLQLLHTPCARPATRQAAIWPVHQGSLGRPEVVHGDLSELAQRKSFRASEDVCEAFATLQPPLAAAPAGAARHMKL